MKGLRHVDGTFVLDVAALHSQFVGASPSFSVEVPPSAGKVIALVPGSRRQFAAGLLRIWGEGRTALLAPGPELLQRFAYDGSLLRSIDSGSLRCVEEGFAEERGEHGLITLRAGDRICEILTSGSSGQPQVFAKTASQLMTEAQALTQVLALGAADCVLATTAFHHVYGLLFGLLAPWFSGARIVADPKNEPSRFHPDEIARLAREHDVTHLITVPAHLTALLDAKVEFSRLRTVVSSAAFLESEIARAFEERYSVQVIDVLGSTETGGIATKRPALGGAFTPLPGVEIFFEEEALLVRSPFVEDPTRFTETGDRARLRDDGTFEHLGRGDGIVKVGGKRISLQEIENLTRSIVGVKDVASLSRKVKSMRGEEILLAVAAEGLEREEIRRALAGKLERVFVPRRIRVLGALPRDERGKLSRKDVEGLFDEEGLFNDVPLPAPERVEVQLSIDEGSPRFRGHFADNPLLPALAQLTDLVLPEIRRHFGGGELSQLSRVKWTHPLRPGAKVALFLQQKTTGIAFEIRSGDTSCCTGTARLR